MPRTVLLVTALLAPTLLGCLSVRTPASTETVRPGPGLAIVFGRVRTFDRGREIDPWTVEPSELAAEDPIVRLALFQLESGRKRPDVPMGSGGRFEWILPAGTYLVYHTPSVEPPFNEPLGAFRVDAGEEPLDLGELRLLLSVDRPLAWRLATYSLLTVESSPPTPETSAWFLERHPAMLSVRRGAFVVDPELGGLFRHWSRETCARILARHGLEIRYR